MREAHACRILELLNSSSAELVDLLGFKIPRAGAKVVNYGKLTGTAGSKQRDAHDAEHLNLAVSLLHANR